MGKSQVNEKYVIALVENNDTTLSVRRVNIPSSEVPIVELEAMVDNPNIGTFTECPYHSDNEAKRILHHTYVPRGNRRYTKEYF